MTMETKDFKYIVGQAQEGKPAVIRFFGPVNAYTTEAFNSEFLYLQDYVQPSKIIVLINSEGGSVVYGMSTYSVIQSCPIDVDCVIEGIAASMGSVIWAAGKRLFMHDYSILMIHNPFSSGMDEEDENTKAMVNAFRGQLETIYCKRFGMKREDVQKLMDGAENVDGTYLNPKDAVSANILPKEHIIKSCKTVRDQIAAKIDGISDASSLRDVMAKAFEDSEDKLTEKTVAILEKNETEPNNRNTMEENKNALFVAVAAQLGFAQDSTPASVSARIAELLKAEGNLKDVQSQLDALQIKYTGKETEVANLTDKLNDVEGQLDKYKKAEADAHAKAIKDMIDGAVASGRIKEDVRAQWTKMAEADFETVKNTLESIPARKTITQAIATDPANVENAAKGTTSAEKEIEDRIKAVIGADFQFKKLD